MARRIPVDQVLSSDSMALIAEFTGSPLLLASGTASLWLEVKVSHLPILVPISVNPLTIDCVGIVALVLVTLN